MEPLGLIEQFYLVGAANRMVSGVPGANMIETVAELRRLYGICLFDSTTIVLLSPASTDGNARVVIYL